MKVAMMNDAEPEDDLNTKPDLLEEETELRLRLPGNGGKNMHTGNGGGGEEKKASVRKRGFLDLSISIPNSEILDGDEKAALDESGADDAYLLKLPSKGQVVGWPPVQSFWKNLVFAQTKISSRTEENEGFGVGAGPVFVKVSMDGAPYLRKLDLKSFKSYLELLAALRNLFSPFATKREKDSTCDGFKYVSTYEDKDGDWMLVGDVPWEMFVESCRRLRMMKGQEAIKTCTKSLEKIPD
ncbi:hypothetical protein MLD38_020218 [Melastoma candidum]|uniref:Uncharacterized protein n=1 Tax=Melastoma candidum TaxID=119954 RepID=A0ACB9QCJ2_9MYRT|nr:hypothetical protein MLD38_020218 [Melastoma candidum]